MFVVSFLRMQSKLWCAAAAALVVAGCGGAPATGSLKQSGIAANGGQGAAISIQGDDSSAVNKIAVKAIGDLQSYWADEFPKLYGKDYRPVEGGFYSVAPSHDDPPPCAEDVSEVAGNAFYCATKDVVAWDAEGLLPEGIETPPHADPTDPNPDAAFNDAYDDWKARNGIERGSEAAQQLDEVVHAFVPRVGSGEHAAEKVQT